MATLSPNLLWQVGDGTEMLTHHTGSRQGTGRVSLIVLSLFSCGREEAGQWTGVLREPQHTHYSVGGPTDPGVSSQAEGPEGWAGGGSVQPQLWPDGPSICLIVLTLGDL